MFVRGARDCLVSCVVSPQFRSDTGAFLEGSQRLERDALRKGYFPFVALVSAKELVELRANPQSDSGPSDCPVHLLRAIFAHGVGSSDAIRSSRRARVSCSSFAPIGLMFCPMWCCSASRRCWCSRLRISRWRRADLALPSTRAANEFRRSSSSFASFARGTSSFESFPCVIYLSNASFDIPSLLLLLSLLPYYYF